MAQEVERVFPDWVREREDGMKLVSVRGFEALSVAALRDLRAEKDAEIDALRSENSELRARLDAVEATLARLAAASAATEAETAAQGTGR